MERLNEYRKRIDELDREILACLKERLGIVREIGLYKQKNGLPVTDSVREADILGKAREAGGEYAENIYRAILRESRAAQENERG